ncbi:MAG: hypothetical protein KFKLKKLM_02648 [Flavobacteriales bacterium]|nr:hypothetical protein [Flavobacteriales bacterium]
MYLGTDDKISQYFLLGYCIFGNYKGVVDIIDKRPYLIHMKHYDLLPIEICLMNNFIEGALYMMKKGANLKEIDKEKVFNGILNNKNPGKKEAIYFLLDNGIELKEDDLYKMIILAKSESKLIEDVLKRVDLLSLNNLIVLLNKNDVAKDIRLYYNQQIQRLLHGKDFEGNYELFINLKSDSD